MGARVVRVAINGYGVIGKRVADAVSLQDDMALAGVSDVVTDYRIRTAVARGHPLFASTAEAWDAMRQAGLPVKGRLEDLLGQTDVIVDCTPKKVAARNRELYAANHVKSIFQGGEKHELTGYSFVAFSAKRCASVRVRPSRRSLPSRPACAETARRSRCH